MKQRYMRLFIAALVIMGSLNIQKTYAKDYFKTMVGSLVDSVLSTGRPEVDGEICYLYNIGDKKRLNAGSIWGTQASMFTDVGLRLWFEKGESIQVIDKNKSTEKKTLYKDSTTSYMMHTDCETTNVGSYLAYHKEGGSSDNVIGLFVDRQTDKNSVCYWHMVKDTTDYNRYYIYFEDGGKRYYLCANPNPTSDGKFDQIQYIEYTDGNYPDQVKKDAYCQWLIITQAQLKSLFTAGTIGDVLDEPADATFYLNDPDLSRNNIHEYMWKVYNVKDDGTTTGNGQTVSSLRLGTEACSKNYISQSASSTGGYSGSNFKSSFLNQNAAYFCADIKKANVKFYQTFKVDKAGWYTLQCQGFYRKGSNSNAKAVLYATIDNYTMTNNLNDLANMDEDGPADLLEAGMAFAKNEYPSGTMFLHITDEDVAKEVEITVGIQTSGKPEWTAFDDFQLKYNGTGSVLILDEMKTQLEMTRLSGNSTFGCYETFKNKTMFLHRDFTPGVWSTIILPVTISKYKFFQAFGAGSKLARFSGLSSTNVMRFQLVDDATTPLSASSDYLVANIPYIVKVTKLPSIAPIDFSSDLHDINKSSRIIATFKIAKGETYYSFPYITLDKKNYDPSGFKDDKVAYSNATYKILAHGKLYCDTKADLTCQSAYILNGNQLRYVTPGTKIMMKAFRCWFTVNNIADGTQYSKGVTLDVEDQEGNVIQTLEDTSTGLVDVTADTKEGKSTIYNMNGQLVKGTLDELPRGLYIVNGKKYVVK